MPTNLNTTPSGTRSPRSNKRFGGRVVEKYDFPEPPKTHYTNVPQEVVRRDPAEWYYPRSESLSKELMPKLTQGPFLRDTGAYFDAADRNRPVFKEYAGRLLGAKDVQYYPVRGPWQGYNDYSTTTFPGSDALPKVVGGSEEAQRKAAEEGDPSDESSDQSGDPSAGGKPTAKPNYDNTVPVDILGFASSQRSNHYVGAGPKPSVPGWSYDPRTAAKHPSYASRRGDVASWDLVEGAPTITWATPIKDGSRWFTHETVLPDYSADWTPLERSTGTYANRMPATNVDAPVKSMQASGLLSPVTSVSYKGADGKQETDTSRFMRLQDLFTDSLIAPPFAGSEAEVSKLLSNSIGDARRDAILESRNGSLSDQIALSTLGRHQLENMHNLALPITYTNDTLPGADQRSVGTGSALRGLGYWDGPMDRATPFHRLFMEDGIVRVKHPEDFESGPSYAPSTHTVNLPEGNSYSPVLDLTAKLKDTEDPYAKFKKAVGLGRLLHWNDSPANAAAETALDKNHRAALRHEGTHAMTSFATNPVASPTVTRAREALRSVRDTMRAKYGNPTVNGVDRWSDKPEYNHYERLQSLIDDLENKPEHGETALGLALGVDSDTENNPQGYAGNNLSEMLRSLHEAKMGYARYLIANARGQSPDEIVETVQDPDKVLDFLQNIYNPMRTKDAPVSYSFPSDMSQVGSEVEMARSLGGIQPLVERLIQAKNNPDSPASYHVDQHTLSPAKDNTQKTNWKRRVITPAQQLEVFRKIWPQVRNNNPDAKYNTLA